MKLTADEERRNAARVADGVTPLEDSQMLQRRIFARNERLSVMEPMFIYRDETEALHHLWINNIPRFSGWQVAPPLTRILGRSIRFLETDALALKLTCRFCGWFVVYTVDEMADHWRFPSREHTTKLRYMNFVEKAFRIAFGAAPEPVS